MSNIYSVSKEFSFEYAHRLILKYESKCHNIHGHTAKVQLKLKTKSVNSDGMVKDFNDFKPFIKFIEDEYDHTLFLNSKDYKLIKTIKDDFGFKVGVIENGNPTSENFAEDIGLAFAIWLNQHVDSINNEWKIICTFYETPTSFAEVSISSKDIDSKSINKIKYNKLREALTEKVKEINHSRQITECNTTVKMHNGILAEFPCENCELANNCQFQVESYPVAGELAIDVH